jgi:hypothetical protein
MATITIEPGVVLDGGITFEPVVPDPYFRYVTLLLSGNGTNGAQNNTFTDSSSNNFSIGSGDTTQGSFSPYGDNWSNYFNGNGDYLSLPNNAALSPAGGDFCIEAWLYPTASPASAAHIYTSNSANGVVTYLNSTRTVSIGYSNNFEIAASATAIPLNAWTHVAFTRSGTTVRVFLNGVQSGSATNSTTFTSTANGTIGYSSGFNSFSGYLSNVRFVKGTAVYTSNFTPPTTPLTAIAGTSLLTCQSNRFIDNSTNNFAITVTGTPKVQRFSPFSPSAAYSAGVTGGSAYFAGSGATLTNTGTTVGQLGSGDFTVECWYYPTTTTFGTGGMQVFRGIFFDSRNSIGDDSNGICFYTNSTGTISAYTSGAAVFTSSNKIKAFAWNHIAFVRSGSIVTCYVNGASGGTFSSEVNFSSGKLRISGSVDYAAGYYELVGYVSSHRIVRGAAVYTSAFTPPTAPLTAIANTSLLLNMTNAGITDSAMINDLQTVGNAQISTSAKKYGTGSMYFDGSGDGLLIPASNTATFGTGDYTVEAWVQLANSAGQYYPQLVNLVDDNGGIPFSIFWGDNGYGYRLAVAFGSLGGQFISAYTQTSFLNTWCHIAVCRSGTTAQVFVDGVQAASYTDSHNYSGAYRIRCGYASNQYGSFYLNGYIDDLRITRGYARYTSNFTPPDDLLNR